MSNLEAHPDELVCPPEEAARARVEILEPREVPLGGPRAMTVHRTLPQRGRTTIGAWCFADHYGPDDVSATGGMVVPPHPHTGLQTVSWLFDGEVEHRDSLGSHALVRPGGVNLMTAGRGISHSEVSTPATTTLHGVQLWTVLPAGSRDTAPRFEHADTAPFDLDDATARVFVGRFAGHGTDVTVYSPLLAAQIDLPAGGEAWLDFDESFEHGLLVDAGPATVTVRADEHERDDRPADADHVGHTGHSFDVERTRLAFVPAGHDGVRVRAEHGPVRIVLIGGEPFGEEIVMWWNFIGRSHDEIAAFRERWQGDVIGGGDPAGLFGTVAGYDGDPLPAPALPTVRLRPRS
ncbi:pirin family protein [Agromyces archimandritae]|uniref:Pirin family protein n=1 Tax=Agromyces archimandritae TaxID=2781962 RepID=A0A975IQZ4_9MICO|nr:pirin family protein [Agromyces archimandritae]QTX05556.1 pirin family protein [Agromyces archimandritae]